MKNLFLLFLVLVISLPAIAQDVEPELKTIFGSKKMKHGGFAAFTADYNQMMGDEQGLTLGFQAAYVMDHKFAIGFAGYGLASSVVYSGLDVDFPEDKYAVEMGYGGLHLEPIIGGKLPIHLSFPVLLGVGYMGYFEAPRNTIDRFDTYYRDLLDEDLFFIVEPGVSLELSLFKHFRIGAGVKYRFFEDLDLISTKSDAYNGFSAGITMKVGAF
ncbi:hypothetical protein N9933_02335 [bacterium]|nr:hypothetical protein [bacterium]